MRANSVSCLDRLLRLLPTALLVALLSPCMVFSQTANGSIVGTVKDSSGGLMPGVAITVRQIETGLIRATLTDEDGRYEIALLEPGDYRITAEMEGFKTEVIRGMTLRVQQTAVLNISLSVGEVSETVEVLGAPSLVESKNASVGAVIERKKIVDLPLNGREVLQLNLLTPGVSPAISGSQLAEQGGAIYANGMREHSNTFLLDGINQTDRAIGQFAVSPIIDTVQEFRVETTSYTSEHGRSAGAHMNVATKAGSNEFRGSLYGFHRNDALDARNFFASEDRDGDGKADAEPLKRSQFGGTIGGPIVGDRAFFFFGYEGTRLRNATVVRTNVPSPNWIQGDFSDLDAPIIDPQTGDPFPGNVIPQERIDPLGLIFAQLYPAPNLPGSSTNLGLSIPNELDTNRYIARVDFNLTSSNKFFARYNVDDFDRFFGVNSFATQSSLPGFGRFDESRFQSLGFSDVHVFSARTVNELRVGYTRWELAFQTEDRVNRVLELGIPGLGGLERNTGWPAINVAGFEPLGDATNNPQSGPGNTFQVSESLYLSRGNHSIKFGVDLWHYRFGNFFLDAVSRGQFNFSGQFSGNSIADMLLGLPFLSLRGVGRSDMTFFQNSYDFFIQDDWRITPNLTLNIGLRYEYNEPYFEDENRFSNFNVGCRCLLLAGEDGVSRSTYDSDPNNFAPRLGFAWDPTGSNKLALRGGYGVYYDATILNTILPLRLSPPFFEFNLAVSDPDTPTLSLQDPFPDDGGEPPLPSPGFFAEDFADGLVQQWSLNFQWEFMPNTLLDVGYLGTKGTHLYRDININAPVPGDSPIQDRRPFPEFGDISGIESSGHSSYNSLQAKVERRFSEGFSILGSYTWSKSIDSNSAFAGNPNDGNTPQNNHDKQAEKALSSFDVRNRLSVSYIWELPLGRGKSFASGASGFWAGLISGWQVAGITTFQSGRPSTPVLSATDNSNTGILQDRPDLVSDRIVLDDIRSGQYVDPQSFRMPSQFTFGNAGRNVITGPGLANFDISLIKSTAIDDSRSIQLRFEFFNAFNRANFDNPVRSFDSPLFGRLTSAANAREVQFGIKILF